MAVHEHGAEVCGCLFPNCFIELFAIQDRQDSVVVVVGELQLI